MSLPAARCRLVGFYNASKSTYAAVVYLVIESDLVCSTQFVVCKTRISPVKEQTIPRLELLLALLLSKLMNSVSQALSRKLSLGEPSYYTYSKVSVHLIEGPERERKPFLQNRVNQIRSITLPHKWAHCTGKNNPVDIPSRGLIYVGSCIARSGYTIPVGSTVKSLTWKTRCRCHKLIRLNSGKLRRLLLQCTCMLVRGDVVNIGSIINCKNFSSREWLVRVPAYVLRFMKPLQQKSFTTGRVTPEELHQAESYWLKVTGYLLWPNLLFTQKIIFFENYAMHNHGHIQNCTNYNLVIT